MPVLTLPARDSHHGLPAHEIALLLGTDPRCTGLDEEEAARRLARFGPTTSGRAPGSGDLRPARGGRA